MFQIARGALLAFSSTMAFAALRRMPVAEFTAIVLLTPVIATLVASVWLKERISPLRWALVVGGFVGALVVIRPGSGIVGWAALLPLAVAFSNATFQIMTSRFAPHEDPFTTNFYTGATGMAIATPILLASAADPIDALLAAPVSQIAALAAIAVLGTSGHLMLIMALSKAPPSTLMPFQYAQLGGGRARRLRRFRRRARRLGVGRHGGHRHLRCGERVAERARGRREATPGDGGGCRHGLGVRPARRRPRSSGSPADRHDRRQSSNGRFRTDESTDPVCLADRFSGAGAVYRR